MESMFGRKRASVTLKIEWSLDDVPGWNFEVDDVPQMIESQVTHSISHYNPTFEVVEAPHRTN